MLRRPVLNTKPSWQNTKDKISSVHGSTICDGLFNMGDSNTTYHANKHSHDRILLLRVARRVVRKYLVVSIVKNNQLCAINFWKLRQYTRYQGIFHTVKAHLCNQPRGGAGHEPLEVHSFFFIRTSNFDAEAERSYIFWRFEAETFLKMFLNLPGTIMNRNYWY